MLYCNNTYRAKTFLYMENVLLLNESPLLPYYRFTRDFFYKDYENNFWLECTNLLKKYRLALKTCKYYTHVGQHQLHVHTFCEKKCVGLMVSMISGSAILRFH